MQQYAAVFRTGDVLKQGCVKMAELYNKMDDLKVFTLNIFTVITDGLQIQIGRVWVKIK